MVITMIASTRVYIQFKSNRFIRFFWYRYIYVYMFLFRNLVSSYCDILIVKHNFQQKDRMPLHCYVKAV